MKSFVIIIVLFIYSLSYTQRTDAGLWTSINTETSFLKKRFFIGVSLNYRMNNLFRNPKTFFPEIFGEVRFLNLFRIGVEYRISMRFRNIAEFLPKQRVGVQLVIRKKLSPIVGSIRMKFQYGNDLRKRNDFFQPKNSMDLRFKFKLMFNKLNIVKPFISNEIFYDLTNHEQGNRLNLNRFSVGAKIDLPKRHEMKIAYIYNLDLNLINPLHEHIIQIAYNYTFKLKKKK